MYAAIDLGTNTIRLLIGEVVGNRILSVGCFRRITRLGGGFCRKKGLSEEAMARTLAGIADFARIVDEHEVQTVAAFGTAALRAAPNAAEFQSRVREMSGFCLDIISGEKEALLGCRGVLSGLAPSPEKGLIFDVGGGSTEFVLYHSGKILFHRSYPLGVVTLSENHSHPLQISAVIDGVLDTLFSDLTASGIDLAQLKGLPLIGTAGTITTLAAVHLGLPVYDSRLINGLVLTSDHLKICRNRFSSVSVTEREALPGMEKGRGDLIMPGLTIVETVLQRLGKKSLIVSDSGLLEGILLFLADGKSNRSDHVFV